jgi:ketosteroid isomerase-like protein
VLICPSGETDGMNLEGAPDHRRRLTELYSAFNRRDIPAALAALASDVLWPNGWEGGTVRGHQEVREYWIRQWEEVDSTAVPMEFNTESDGRVAVRVHQVVRDKAGATMVDETVVHMYRFADGRVTDMEIRR